MFPWLSKPYTNALECDHFIIHSLIPTFIIFFLLFLNPPTSFLCQNIYTFAVSHFWRYTRQSEPLTVCFNPGQCGSVVQSIILCIGSSLFQFPPGTYLSVCFFLFLFFFPLSSSLSKEKNIFFSEIKRINIGG